MRNITIQFICSCFLSIWHIIRALIKYVFFFMELIFLVELSDRFFFIFHHTTTVTDTEVEAVNRLAWDGSQTFWHRKLSDLRHIYRLVIQNGSAQDRHYKRWQVNWRPQLWCWLLHTATTIERNTQNKTKIQNIYCPLINKLNKWLIVVFTIV